VQALESLHLPLIQVTDPDIPEEREEELLGHVCPSAATGSALDHRLLYVDACGWPRGHRIVKAGLCSRRRQRRTLSQAFVETFLRPFALSVRRQPRYRSDFALGVAHQMSHPLNTLGTGNGPAWKDENRDHSAPGLARRLPVVSSRFERSSCSPVSVSGTFGNEAGLRQANLISDASRPRG
jgi:hypothetical protein